MKTAIGSFCFLFTTGTLVAQVNDAQLWTGAGVTADITKDITVSYEQQTRFYKNVTALDNYYNEFGADYKVAKGFTMGVDYRYSLKNKESYFETVHRLCINAAYSYKLDDLGIRLKFRARYQFPFTRLGVVNENIYPDTKNTLRFKLTANYTPTNLKMVQPFISYEIYKGIKPVNQYYSIDSYRFSIGVTLDLPKRHSVDLYYMLEKEYHAIQYNNHIWGIQYNYDLFKNPVVEAPKTE